MATFRKTPSNTFQAIVRLKGFKDQTKTFKLKKDARAWAARVEGDHDLLRALGSEAATMTFTELADEYESQWTGKDNITGKMKFWTEALGARPLLNITTSLVRSILEEHAAGTALCGKGRHDTGRTRAPATVNRKRAMLSAVFKYAMGKEYITKNPVAGTPSLTENNKRKRYLDDNERHALLFACRESDWDKLYLLALMALTCGARQGELLKLSWSDINFSTRLVQLRDTKNSSDRTISLTQGVIEELLRFRKVGSVLIFPSPTNSAKAFEFRKHWDKALIAADIEGFHFHDLRHSCASMMLNADATLGQIGAVLGHKSTQTTARYAHLSEGKQQTLMDSVMDSVI